MFVNGGDGQGGSDEQAIDVGVSRTATNNQNTTLNDANEKDPRDSTVIIRADGRVATKYVREMINMCQELGFETYTLRAKAERAPG